MTIYQDKRSGNWKVQIRPRGRTPVFETFKQSEGNAHERAKAFHAEWTARLNRDPHGGAYNQLAKQTVWDVLDWYAINIAPHRRSKADLLGRVKQFKAAPFSRMYLTDNVALGLQEYVDDRLKQGLKVMTVRKDVALFRTFFRSAMAPVKGCIPVMINPATIVQLPPGDDVPRSVLWTDAMLDEFLDAVEFDPEAPPLRAFDFLGWYISLLRYIGMRGHSLADVKISSIDMRAKVIHFPAGALKNSKAWDCPVSGRGRALLARLLRHRQEATPLLKRDKGGPVYLFPTTKGTMRTYYNLIRNGLKEGDPETWGDVHIHDQRHTHHTALWHDLGPEDRNETFMLNATGREDAKSLQRYINLKGSDIADTMDDVDAGALDPLKRGVKRPLLQVVGGSEGPVPARRKVPNTARKAVPKPATAA